MSKKITSIFCVLCGVFMSFATYAQDITVTGKVTSKTDGQPLPGVTVKVDGTTRAASTNNAGIYTIAVPSAGSKLHFSLLGMATKTVTVTAAGTINVVLEDEVGNLSDVVVVGYGTQKKSVVTGAISSVKASDLENQPVMRIEQALQGRTSGLTIAAASGQPGANATVRLRGLTSLGNDKNDPLWVIDGVIVDNGGIGYLNQSDIESIEVLKDAASAAIYGTRAAAGVILVTTKKGKAGSVQINYNTFYGISAPAKRLDLLNASQYATIRNESFAADPLNAGKPLPYPNPASLGEGTDWQKEIFVNDAKKYTHELRISGGR